MIGKANEARNKKAPGQVRALSQGKANEARNAANIKDTTLDADKARYLKGIQLYQSGAVLIGQDGMFYCNGYRVSPDGKLSCDCKDFQLRGRPCKHIYAVWQFQKNGVPKDPLLWFN
jgi:uncharacterized Zn finger protein